MKSKREWFRSIVAAGLLVVSIAMLGTTAHASGNVGLDEEHFPDSIFRQYISDNVDLDHNGVLSQDEILAVTAIECSFLGDDEDDEDAGGIRSLKGIEYFTNLEKLMCSYNPLAELDLSSNTALTELVCMFCRIRELDLSSAPNLVSLYCNDNWLEFLDLSGNPLLEEFDCYGNNLRELDLHKQTELKLLHCGENELTTLDLSANKKLQFLECGYNYLTELDLTDLTKLEQLSCNNNRIIELNLEKCSGLKELHCDDNAIKKLDVSMLSLIALNCRANFLEELVLGEQEKLTTLDSRYCQMTELDISGCPKLISYTKKYEANCYNHTVGFYKDEEVYIAFDRYVTITPAAVDSSYKLENTEWFVENFSDGRFRDALVTDYDKNGDLLITQDELDNITELSRLDNIRSLKGVELMPALEKIFVDCDRMLAECDLSHNSKLTSFGIQGGSNDLIDLSGNPALTQIFIANGNYRQIVLGDKPELKEIAVFNLPIEELDLTKAPKLQRVECESCDLQELDLSANTELLYLSCEDNRLTGLNLRNNSKLEQLICDRNKLSELDISNNPELGVIDCYGNSISELNINRNDSLLKAFLKGEEEHNKSIEFNREKNAWVEYPCTIYLYEDEKKVLAICADESTMIITEEKMPVFADVAAGIWYEPAAQFVYSRGLMVGKSQDEEGAVYFAPNDRITRAEFATILYNKQKKPKVGFEEIFRDVKDGKWFAKPVLWLQKQEIVAGYPNGNFGVSDPITREQLAVILYKYAQMNGEDMTYNADTLEKFGDKDKASEWAREALEWITDKEIMKGSKEEVPMLNPKGNTTRAECAALIKNYIQKVEEAK